jgi:hypothetical protein
MTLSKGKSETLSLGEPASRANELCELREVRTARDFEVRFQKKAMFRVPQLLLSLFDLNVSACAANSRFARNLALGG